MSAYTEPKKERNPYLSSSLKSGVTDPREATAQEDSGEERIKVDGFGQVIALLEVADPAFRESLIQRIHAKDPYLARQIRARLG
jgi:flagellar motor switch protein FliG